jgi:hypothetical protein
VVLIRSRDAQHGAFIFFGIFMTNNKGKKSTHTHTGKMKFSTLSLHLKLNRAGFQSRHFFEAALLLDDNFDSLQLSFGNVKGSLTVEMREARYFVLVL